MSDDGIDASVCSSTEPPSDYEELEPSQSENGFRIHLSASRLAAWFGLESDERNMGRVTLIDKWHAPRAPRTGRPNPRTTWGNSNERKGIDTYIAFTGIDAELVTKASFVEHPEHRYLGAAPDALVGDNGLLEVKCPHRLRDDAAQSVTLETKWLLQMWLQLECTGRAWCDLCVYAEEYIWVWRMTRQTSRELWDMALPHLERYPELLTFGQAGTIEVRDPKPMLYSEFLEVRSALAELRGSCVKQIALAQKGDRVTWEASNELRNDPIKFNVIDRFSNTLIDCKPMEGRMPMSRWLNMRYTSSDMVTYTTEPISRSGGVIRSEYWLVRPPDEPTVPRGKYAWNVTTAATPDATATRGLKRPLPVATSESTATA